MSVVSDAGPLIGLAEIDHFGLLRKLFGRLYVPTAVYHEVVVEGKGRPGAEEVETAVQEGWLEVMEVQESVALVLLKVDLDDGEAESLILAGERGAALLLMDERKGRIRAKAMGLPLTGTVGVLILAREKGIELDLQAALDALRNKGFRMSDELYKTVLEGM